MKQSNKDLLFNISLKNALPYLILAPPEFRNKLAEQMDGLFHFFGGGDSSITAFNQCNDGILEMLKEAEGSFDSTTNRRIESFDRMYKSFDERISELHEMVLSLKNGQKLPHSIKKDTISMVKKIQVEIPTISSTEPNMSSISRKRSTRYEQEQRLELLKNYLKTNGEINNQKCREICNINTQQASCLLHKLVKDNFIEQIGPKFSAKYIKYIIKE